MKTKFLLFAILLITTITFSQTSKKGHDHYKAQSDVSKSQIMDKGESTDAWVKYLKNKKRRTARTGRNPQTGGTIVNSGTIEVKGDFINNELDPTIVQQRRQRPFDEKLEQRNNSVQKNNRNHIRKKPGRTKATDYNSSRSNRDTTNY